MGKRVVLFIITNLAIVTTISILVTLLGFGGRIHASLLPLALFCLIWGMLGSLISLQISRFMAKRAMGVALIDGRTGNVDLDWLYNTVANLTGQAQLPMPEVGIYDAPEVNAFATGPSKKRSLVAVSSGLLRSMSRREIEGVLAHEVSHIANGDMVTMALLQGVVNSFVLFFAHLAAMAVRQAIAARDENGDGRGAHAIAFLVRIVLEIVLGILGAMVTAWFSRQREFRADAGAAKLAGRENMIAALRQLLAAKDRVDVSNAALASFKIAGGPGFLTLFATHPPLPARIAALETLILH